MVRKIALMLLTVIGFHPGVVSALGLGELTLHSSLNEPLNAEIELLQVEDLAVEEILVGLATQKDFERNNVERFHHLTFIRFKVKFRNNGAAYVQVSSRVPVREPYLNFLVDAQWPGGRLLREYTLLLDLPVFNDTSQLNMVQQPSVADEPEPVEEIQQTKPSTDYPVDNSEISSEPDTLEQADEQVDIASDELSSSTEEIESSEDQVPSDDEVSTTEEQILDTNDDSTTIAESTDDEATSPATEQVSEVSDAEEESGFKQTTSTTPVDYDQVSEYQVNTSDTLWDIARKVRPNRSVSIQQTMLAIQRLNPNAFINDNINLVKRGQVLTVPSLEEIESLNKNSAIQQVALQNHRVTDDLGQIDASSRSTDTVDTTADDSRMKLVTESADDITDSDSTEDLIGTLETDLTLALEERDRILLENTDLKTQLTDLEDQINSLQKLITVKENKLAALQVQLANQQQQAEQPVDEADSLSDTETASTDEGDLTTTDDNLDTEITPKSDETMTDELLPADADTSDLLVVETPDLTTDDSSDTNLLISPDKEDVVVDDTSLDISTEVDSSTELTTTSPDTQITAPVTETTPAKTETDFVTPKQPVGFVDSVMSFIVNNLYVAIIVGMFLIIIVILIMVKMRQGKDEDEDDLDQFMEPEQIDTEITTETDSGIAEDSKADIDLGGSVAFDTEILDEEREVNLDNPDEVIAEADVCMAYGRFDQATYLLSRALETYQDHQEMRLKLMEVFAETKDETGFEIQESILIELGNDDALLRIAELKKKAFGVSSADENIIELPDEEIDLDISLDEDDLDSEVTDENAEIEVDFDTELDDEDLNLAMDLDGGDDLELDDETSIEPALDSDTDEDSLNSGLDKEFDLTEAAEPEMDTDEATIDTDDLLDEESSTIDDAADDATEEDLFSEDLNFEDLDLDADFDEDFELDSDSDLGLDFDLNEFDADDSDNAEAEDDEVLDEITDSSATETDSTSSEQDSIAALAENTDDGLDMLEPTGLDETDDLDLSLDDNLEDELADVLADDNIDDEVEDLDLDLGDDTETTDDDLDFNLEEFALDADDDTDSAADKLLGENESTDDIDALDFDFDSSDELDSEDQLGDDLDFDSLLEPADDDSETSKSEESAEPPTLESNEEILDGLDDDLEFSLDDGTIDDDDAVDDFDLDLDLGDDDDSDSTISLDDDLLDGEDDLDFLSDTDETATKLDLARAYIDMGDKNGAQDILNEVIAEGSENQQKEAKDLLERI